MKTKFCPLDRTIRCEWCTEPPEGYICPLKRGTNK